MREPPANQSSRVNIPLCMVELLVAVQLRSAAANSCVGAAEAKKKFVNRHCLLAAADVLVHEDRPSRTSGQGELC